MANTIKDTDDDEIPERYIDEDNDTMSEIEQMRAYLSRRYDFRYNTVSNVIECREKNRNNKKELPPFQEMDEGPVLYDLNTKFNKGDSTKLGYILSVIMEKYNPFEEYFEGLKKWDGKNNYIEKLAYHFTIKHAEVAGYTQEDCQIRFYQHLRKHIVRIVACALHPTYINKHCFVILGAQHDGKSFFNRWLCPPALSGYMAENISVDKDSQIALCENIIINLDELATISKYDLNTLKSFFSKGDVKVRPPYGRRAVTKKRTASFVGNTNNHEFLNDVTGSVRWLSFEVEKINRAYSKEININDVYAQAYYLYCNGFKFDLDETEIKENEKFNDKHFITNSEMELIAEHYSPDGDDYFTATQVLEKLLRVSLVKNLTLKGVGAALQKLGFEKATKYDEARKFNRKCYKGRIIEEGGSIPEQQYNKS